MRTLPEQCLNAPATKAADHVHGRSSNYGEHALVTGSGALAAGLLLVLTTVAFATAGVLLGVLVDVKFIGGLAGGVLGTVTGFVLVWRKYVAPANEEDAHRDYSHIRPYEEDDDDDW